jgi:endonuclease G
MTHEERVQRLATMLSQVAGANGLESLSVPPPAASVEESAPGTDAIREKAQVALRKLRNGEDISPDEAFGLEAIVLPDKRPVVFIHNNAFDTVLMDEWVHLNKPEVHARLEKWFPSIGRIELPMTPDIPYGGTGFVVGRNLLMTNRHVARRFSEGLGLNVTYFAGHSAIDFQREEGMPEPPASAWLQIVRVRMIHPFWDMALLEVDGLPPTAKPIPMSVQPPEAFEGKDVVVVGYPMRDYRNDLDVQDRVFARKYGVKRMQPGKGRQGASVESFGHPVDAMTHDSSTLGGNSGSAVIEVATGTVIGLHFGGLYLKANYAVPTYELARDRRVVKAELNFQGSVSPTTQWDRWWDSLETVGRGAIRPGGGDGDRTHASAPTEPRLDTTGGTPHVPGVSASASDTAQATFVIPIHLTISLGTPTRTDASARPTVAAETDIAAGEALVEKVPVIYPDMESREGYQEGFLELANGRTVPMPKLTTAGKAVAAKLDDGSPVLNYHHFAIVMHKKRRLALFTAANVDWRPEKHEADGKKPDRDELDGFTGNEREDWVLDTRIPADHQLPDYFYRKGGGAFDRGHLVRRDDVAWGDSFEDMQKGNGDTFHMTNCSPQTAGFNRPAEHNWGALEQMVQRQTAAEKVCIFSGPVLDESDPYFHGLIKSGVRVSVQIPQRFWKIIVANQGGKPAAFGFVLDQDLSDVDLYAEMAVPDAWKKFMRSIPEIEGYLHGLAKLTWFKEFDQFDGASNPPRPDVRTP